MHHWYESATAYSLPCPVPGGQALASPSLAPSILIGPEHAYPRETPQRVSVGAQHLRLIPNYLEGAEPQCYPTSRGLYRQVARMLIPHALLPPLPISANAQPSIHAARAPRRCAYQDAQGGSEVSRALQDREIWSPSWSRDKRVVIHPYKTTRTLYGYRVLYRTAVVTVFPVHLSGGNLPERRYILYGACVKTPHVQPRVPHSSTLALRHYRQSGATANK